MPQRSDPDLHAFTPVELSAGDTTFIRIGAAWRNKRDGYNIRLNALPINGQIVLFPPRCAEDAAQPS